MNDFVLLRDQLGFNELKNLVVDFQFPVKNGRIEGLNKQKLYIFDELVGDGVYFVYERFDVVFEFQFHFFVAPFKDGFHQLESIIVDFVLEIFHLCVLLQIYQRIKPF